jgi:hypothetical protein
VFSQTQTAFNQTSCAQKDVYVLHIVIIQKRDVRGTKKTLNRGAINGATWQVLWHILRVTQRYIKHKLLRSAHFYCIQHVSIQYCLRNMHPAVGLRWAQITWVTSSAFCFTTGCKKPLWYHVEHSYKGTERPGRQADIDGRSVSTSFPIKHTK